jgi:methionyl-tRNA synthetase
MGKFQITGILLDLIQIKFSHLGFSILLIAKTLFFLMLEQDLVIILEALRIIAIALSPVTPSLSWRIYAQLGFSKDQFDTARWVSLSLSSLSLSHTQKQTYI